MKIVTTLPIKPPSGASSVLKMVTFYVSDVLSKFLGVKNVISINVKGSKANSGALEDYLNRLGIKWAKIFRDDEVNYGTFFKNKVLGLIGEGIIKKEKRTLLYCKCGKTEIPEEPIEQIVKDGKRKSGVRLIGKNLTCVFCNECLGRTNADVLIFKLIDSDFNVNPSILKAEVCGMKKTLLNHDYFISRILKIERESINIDGTNFNFDNDFFWSFYLNYIARSDDEIILVCGRASLINAVRTRLIVNTLNNKINIKIFIHPLIEIIDYEQKRKTFSVADIVGLCPRVQDIRALISLGLNPYKSKNILSIRELFFLKKTPFDLVKSTGDLDNNLDLVAPQFRELKNRYKELRRGKCATKDGDILFSVVN